MAFRRSLAVGLTLLVVLGFTLVRAQQGGGGGDGAPPRNLDADVVAVRLLLGVGDRQVQTWGGRVTVDRGDVVGVEGYRFRKGDKVSGPGAWDARSLVIRKAAAKKAAAKKAAAKKATKDTGPGTSGPSVTPNGVIVSVKGPAEATLTVETSPGTFKVPLAELADGRPHRYLGGKVEAQRVTTSAPLLDGPEQDDFPAAAADAQGGAWVAYVAHKPYGPEFLESFQERPKSFAEFAPKGGGDQVRLLRFADGKASEPIDVTGAGLDVLRPAVAVAGDGSVVVAWSENQGGNWDLYRKLYDPAKKSWSEPKRLTEAAGADADVVLATAPDGKVWMAWQSWIGEQADVLIAPVEDAAKPTNISNHPANDWSPSLAFDKSGRFFVAFDSYRSGSYDALVWTATPAGGRLVTVAGSPRYEARPTVAVDPSGRAWVAYEERDANWGKDAENLVEGKGSTLYRSAAVKVRCIDGERLLEAPDPVAGALELRERNSYPRIAVDRDGRPWLAFRNRMEAIWGGPAVMVVGGVWVEYATALSGQGWEAPQLLPRSDGLLDNRPALVVPSEGPVLAVYSTDGRLRHEVEFNPERNRRFWPHGGTPSGDESSFDEDLQVAALAPLSKGGTIAPALGAVATENGTTPAVHPQEQADVARMKGHRIQAGGKTYRLLRGDFHRHTELSMDGGADGSLEDMWRYALDAAGFDWMGNDDHDNGGGKEYTWWLAQKTTDLYNHPNFVTMFTYERSVTYPHGHRNIMFAKRGIRTLPRLVDATGAVIDDDTMMLYDYLKEHDGLCASHTSGTGMGTDWRDVNPQLEPMVEIFQGHRNSYEYLGAPRVARRAGEAIGGWRPLGMVWNALAMQYKLGFQASSDHISTHISYAIAVAEDASREAILDAFRKRHCYGATDNIVLDVRSGEHIMGDEFDADGPVRLKILAHGTRPIARVDIIKDFRYAYSTEPRRARVEFEWKDEEKRPAGQSWYYVRVMQDDGQIAWGSPFWVRTVNTQASR